MSARLESGKSFVGEYLTTRGQRSLARSSVFSNNAVGSACSLVSPNGIAVS
jgi:hypothetical protein